MKRNRTIIGLAGVLGIYLGLFSCAPDYETQFEVHTLVVPNESQGLVSFPLTGGKDTIEVQIQNIPFDAWHAESNADWCKLEKQADKVIVTADKNEIYTQRQAQITIAYGHQSYDIDVMQFGLEPIILINGKKDGYVKEVYPQTSSVTIPVTTNLNLDNIIVPDTCNWVHFVEQPDALNAGDATKINLKFNLDQNTDTVERYCSIILQSSENYSHTGTFLIKQLQRGYIIEAADSVKTFQVPASGKTIEVPFKINGPATAPYSYTIDAEWITPVTVAATRGMRDESLSFVIKPSTSPSPRTGHITFTTGNTEDENGTFTVTVNQDAYVPTPPENVVNPTATPGPGYITLNWSLPDNLNYTKIIITYDDPVNGGQQSIEIDDNTVTTTKIPNTYKCGGTYTFTIKTYDPAGMETETPLTVEGTSDESPGVKMPIDLTECTLTDNAGETAVGDNAGLSALTDDDVTTYYHTLYSALSTGSKPHYVQIDFPEGQAYKTFRFEYDGRDTANNGGDVTKVGIWGSDTGSDDDFWIELGIEQYTMIADTPAAHYDPDVVVKADKAYRHIRFIPMACRRVDPLDATVTKTAWWNMSNMYLYYMDKDEDWARSQLSLM